MKRFRAWALAAALCGTIGCSGVNKVDRGLDMASERVGFDKPVYEGKLKTSKKIGALVALEFVDGQTFEVSDSPSDLMPGDVVRVYKTDNGYVAHLYHASTTPLPPGVPPPASPSK